MANENIGGISWVVDADTAPAINSIKGMADQVKRAEKSLDKLDSSTDKTAGKIAILDKATADYTAELRKNGSTISKTGVVLDKYGQVNAEATKHIQGLSNAQMKMSKTAAGVKTGLAGASRGLGQASVQAQQFIGQVQGGQSVLLAFSQQIADVGIVLGAPLLGAIAGISASLVGMLLPSIMSSKTGLEMLETATKNVKAALTLSVDGVIEYTDQMRKLKQVSESLAKIKVATLIAEQQTALDEAGKSFKQALSDAQGWATGYGAVYKIFKNETAEARSSLKELKKTAKEFSADNATESIERLEKALGRAEKAGINNTKVGRELANQMVALIAGYKTGEKTIADLDARLKDLNFEKDESAKKTETEANSIKTMVTALREQAQQLKETNRQTAIRVATEKGATAEQLKSINASFDKIEANDKLIKKQKEMDAEMNASFNAEAARGRKKKAAEAKAVKDAEAAAAKAKAKEEVEKETLTAAATGIAGTRGDPLAELASQKTAELKILEDAEKAGLQLHTDYTTLRKNIDDQYAAAEAAAREKKFLAESEMNALVLSSIDALGAASTNVIHGMLDGTMTAKDAMLQLSNAILNEVIGSLVGIGVQYVKNALIEQSVDQASVVSKQALMATQAAAHTAAVTAAVTELASLGAAAAMASTAAIPLVGPAAAPAAGAAMGAAVTAAGAPAIASAPIAGMREHGGSVISGQTYEVGEKNKPELLMIPGNNGKVLSNAEMKSMSGGSGGGNVSVNLFGAPANTSVESRQDPLTKEQVIDIVVGQMGSSNSPGQRAQQRVTNVNNTLNGQRRR